MSESSHWIGALVALLLGGGGLLGWFKYVSERDKVPAEIRLTNATARKAEVEAEGEIFDRMDRYIDRLEKRIDSLESENRILDEQLKREAAFRESKGLKLTD